MRIIAGKHKGLKLCTFDDSRIRPSLDKVKQSIFTKLQFQIENTNVLDLFCGTGSLGIEAISRGAKNVVFCDKSKDSCIITKKNLSKIKESANVFNCDYSAFLRKNKTQFDLILLDPPYHKGLYEDVLQNISKHNALSNDGIIVCEHSFDVTFDYDDFKLLDQKNYGTVRVTYLGLK